MFNLQFTGMKNRLLNQVRIHVRFSFMNVCALMKPTAILHLHQRSADSSYTILQVIGLVASSTTDPLVGNST